MSVNALSALCREAPVRRKSTVLCGGQQNGALHEARDRFIWTWLT